MEIQSRSIMRISINLFYYLSKERPNNNYSHSLFSLWVRCGSVLVDCTHEDVIKWKHFPRYWPFVRGIHRSPVNYPHKGQWRGGLMCFICVWINGWVNNREAGDLKRYCAHYDVIVMWYCSLLFQNHLGSHTLTPSAIEAYPIPMKMGQYFIYRQISNIGRNFAENIMLITQM